jgi:hypothetical protein
MSKGRPGFGAFRKAQEAMKKGGGGGSKTPWESYIFNMQPGAVAGIRFFDNSTVRHTHGFPNQTCTADIEGFDGKCVPCYWNERSDEFSKSYRRGKAFVIEMLDYRYQHWDFSGDKPKVHDCQESEPLPRRNRCRHCNSTDLSLKERHFGGRKRWEMGKTVYNQTMEILVKLEGICVAQVDAEDPEKLCGDTVDILAYNCGNEKCGVEVITERDLQTKDVSEVLDEPFPCEECNETEWLVPVNACRSDAHEAVPGSIFDKIIEVSCSGEQKSFGGKTKTVRAYNFDRNVAPWSSVEEDLKAFGISDEEAAKILKPDDLLRRFAPFNLKVSEFSGNDEYVAKVLEEQAKWCGRSVPPEWLSSGGGGATSTGRTPWRRR